MTIARDGLVVSQPLPIHPSCVPETIYRRYFVGGILVILSVGAVWGAYLLWQVSKAGSFTGVSIHAVNAHGHAQIFGWVGMFVMGFAYQALPRMWRVGLAGPHLAVLNFLLLVLSLVLSTTGTALAETWSYAASAVIVGGFLQIVAVCIFAGQLAVTFWRSSGAISPAVAFMFAAMTWFVLMSVMNLWHTLALMQAETREALLAQIGTYQGALRDMQIHGLGVSMILGVSMRFFPGMFGVRPTPAGRGWAAFGLFHVAIVAQVTLLIASQQTGSYALAAALVVPWLMLATGAALVVLPWRIWRPLPKRARSGKYVRAAFAWLGVSLLMLLALPGYVALNEMTFSHAYYGAIRHAVTVGCISMMIMAVSLQVVPVLRGADLSRLGAMWGPFVLVNVGCLLRVSLQIMSDRHEAAYSWIALSGVLEVTGLGWWGVSLLMLMWMRQGSESV